MTRALCTILLGCWSLALLFSTSPTAAQTTTARLLEPLVFDEFAEPPTWIAARSANSEVLRAQGRELEQLLRDGMQDLELAPPPAPAQSQPLDEAALTELSRQAWVIAPRLRPTAAGFELRLIVVPPDSKLALVEVQEIRADKLEIRTMVMLRDLVQAGRRLVQPTTEVIETTPTVASSQAATARSEGRAVLALNAAVLGGYVGFSIQRASGTDDARLVYPLTALGAGIGLGGSMLVADEWDIQLGDAWYLSGSMVWPGVSGLLLAESYSADESTRYLWGLAGASAGLTLATTSLSFGHVSQGGALFTHSGALVGLLLGGVTEGIVDGSIEETPIRGLGYGAGIGVLGAGIVATQLELSPSRVLLVDLSASLGALTGAALGSPLLLVESDESETRNRIWLSAVAAGTLAGATVGWVLAQPASSLEAAGPMLWPALGVVGVTPEGLPVYGAAIRGGL